MTAGLLRRAAAEMRRAHGSSHPRPRFWSRLADWLESEEPEADLEFDWGDHSYPSRYALAVARAYLGEEGGS